MKERTLAILKPDCIQKRLTGKVIDRLLEADFNIIAMKLVRLNRKTAGEFYCVHKQRPFYEGLLDFMTECGVVAFVLEKDNAVNDLRKIIGSTDPAEAEEGTIRKLYADNTRKNIIHGSDSNDSAKREIMFFFSEIELIENS